MKYLLSQEEYDTLRIRKEDAIAENDEELQKFCTMVADTLPIKFWGRTEAKPWQCLISRERDNEEWYCDECPSQKVCPYPHKAWSK